MNTILQGQRGLGSAIEYYSSLGYIVSLPLTDITKYDLIIDGGEGLLKVQVKSCSYVMEGRNVYCVQLSTKCNNGGIRGVFNKNDVDYLYIVTTGGDRYSIKSTFVDCKHTMQLGEKYSKYKI